MPITSAADLALNNASALRTAIASPAPTTGPGIDPIIAAYGRDLGPRTTDAVNTIVNGLGPYAISRRNLTDRTFNFAEGTAFGLRLEEKSYDQKDPYVQSCPVRKAVAENLQRTGGGRKVSYVETAGLAEIGGGFLATLPVEAFAYGGIGVNYGFTASALMRYRSSTPQLLGFGERPESRVRNGLMAFPTSAEKALAMLPGSEVEITGQGRVLVNAAVSGRVGYGIPLLATAGIGAVISGVTTIENETSLNVLALDKPGKVRVTLRNLDEETAGIIARIRAGLIFGVGNVAPAIVGGMLRYYTEKLGAPNFEELVNLYTTLYATFTARMAHRGLTIGSWDLDLNTPEGRQTYEQLLLLNTVHAEELAHSGHPAVTDVHFKENESEFKFGADVGMLGQKLFIYEALRTEREGRLTGAGDKKMIYRDSLYTRRKKNILTGSKEINWEAVSVKKDNGASEPFLRVHFEQKDWDFRTDGIERTLRFAEAMGIPDAEFVGTDKARLKAAKTRLHKMAEVQLSTDIYFTKKGVENIDKADAMQAKDAFLKVSSQIRRKFKNIDFTAKDDQTKAALELIAEYNSYLGIANVKKLPDRIRVLPQIRKEYFELTGRKILSDAKLIRQAEDFGSAVERLTDTRNPEQVASFFLDIGEHKGFDYRQTVAALSQLAGHSERLVNNLAIAAGGVTIRHDSEGALTNPRDTVTNELYRTASI